MEDYLGINPDGTPIQPSDGGETNDDNQLAGGEDLSPVFEPFKDLCKRRFLWYYDSYLDSIKEESAKVQENQPFAKMPFEGSGNTMDGKFLYPDLERRLKTIKRKLEGEAEIWAAEGLQSKQKETGVAANLQRQFEQTKEYYKKNDAVTLDLELVDDNPFVWRVVRFTILAYFSF